MKRAGMLLVLAAVSCLNCICGSSCNLVFWTMAHCTPFHPFMQVFRMKKGGVIIFAPPCSTWVFLILICIKGRVFQYIPVPAINVRYIIVQLIYAQTVFKVIRNNWQDMVGPRVCQNQSSEASQHIHKEDAVCAP